MRFRKRPTEVDAFRLVLGAHMPEWLLEATDAGLVEPNLREARETHHVSVLTLHGWTRADLGDWIIRGEGGDLWPCKHDIFVASYEPA